MLQILPPERQQRIGWTWDQAIVQTGGYFYSRVVLMLINSAGFFLTLVAVGMPTAMSVPLDIFAGFVAAFIPAIGSYLGSAVPIIMTLAIQGLVAALITALVSNFVPKNEVVYSFEYEQHLVAAEEAAEDRSATND